MRSVFSLAILSGALVVGMPAPSCRAQNAILPTQVPLNSMIEASDGNLYGLFAGQANPNPNGGCAKGVPDACGGIYVARKDGTVSEIHSFGGGGFPNADGNVPTSLVEAPDGFLYGTTLYGGLGGTSGCYGNGCGTFFRVGLDGATGPQAAFTVLHDFSYAEATQGGQIIVGGNDDFYGAGGQNDFGANTIYRIANTGAVTVLYNFGFGATPPNPYANGSFPSGVVQGTDGNFYGTTLANGTAGTDGTVFQLTPAGKLTTIATFPGDGSRGVNPTGALVEGVDGAFYGLTRGAGVNANTLFTPVATAFRVTAQGEFETLHTFSSATDGAYPLSPLIAASDGYLYGTAFYGGDPAHCKTFQGCGALFGLTTGGEFTTVLRFEGGTGAAYPSTLFSHDDGTVGGTAGSDGTPGSDPGTIFFEPEISSTLAQVPIGVRFRDPATGKLTSEVKPGTALDVEWAVANAFSITMQNCAAFRDDAQDPDWTGLQPGTLSAVKIYEGTTPITAPMKAGTYTYALTCGGVESGFGVLTVGNNLTITTTSLPNATVSVAYADTLAATGGTPPYTWSLEGGQIGSENFKAVDVSPSGVLSAEAVQSGSHEIDVQVTDSSTTPQVVTKTLTLLVNSGLNLALSLPPAVTGVAYSQSLQASGGIAPYTYKLVSGALPAGLSLNATTGVISGTPIQAVPSTFAIMVSDFEGTPAMFTQSYMFTTKAPPLVITSASALPDLAVNVSYSDTLAASGGVPPYTWSVSPVTGGGLPAGVTLSAGGVLSGRPLQFSSGQTLGVRVTDSSTPALMQDAALSYTIISGLVATSPAAPAARVGVSYATPAPRASGGLPPYVWNARGNPPPVGSGLSIDPATGILSGIPTLAGVYTFTLTAVDSEGAPANASTLAAVTVLPTAVPSVTTLTSSNPAAGTGMPVTFTATVVARSGSVPSGTVIFYNGTANLGTATINAAGTAMLTTTFATTGVYSITAAYSGDSGTSPSTSSAVTETVVKPSVTATVNPVTLTLQAGSSGTIVLTVAPVGGYTGAVTFSCGTVPAHVSCTFSPPSLTIPTGGAAVMDTLTINTRAATSAENRVPRLGGEGGQGLTMAMALWLPEPLLLWGAWSRRRRLVKLSSTLGAVALLAIGAAGLGMLNGCGSASNKAAPGSYTVSINVTAGAALQSVNATVVVQ